MNCLQIDEEERAYRYRHPGAGRKTKLTEKLRAAIIADRKLTGLGYNSLAEKYGLSRDTVFRVCKVLKG